MKEKYKKHEAKTRQSQNMHTHHKLTERKGNTDWNTQGGKINKTWVETRRDGQTTTVEGKEQRPKSQVTQNTKKGLQSKTGETKPQEGK